MNGSSIHAGLRTRLSGDDFADYEDDDRQGFLRILADDIDESRPQGVVENILERIGTEVPVYLGIDIDVSDPGVAPGTGTPEPGGWTMRELIRILRGIEGLHVVGAVSYNFFVISYTPMPSSVWMFGWFIRCIFFALFLSW